MKLELDVHTFEKHLNIKFHENPPSGSPVVPCGQMYWWTDGQTWRS